MNNFWPEMETAPLDFWGYEKTGETYGWESEDDDEEDSGFDEEDYAGEQYFLAESESEEVDYKNSRWSEELEALAMMEEESYLPQEDILLDFAEYEPDLFDDSEELSEALREVLDENYRDASSEEMQEALLNVLEALPLSEGFNFKKILGQISKGGRSVLRNPVVGQIARTVLPAAGAAIGTVYGGPLGTAVGGKLGQVAGQAFTGGRKPSRTGSPGGQPPTPAQGGSPAAAQLLQLTQNPDMLKSLMALALGSQGKKSIQVGQNGPAVPVGGFLNLLGTLVNKAAADADELSREGGGESTYLQDSEGNFRVDPYVPEERARVLYEMLSEAESQRSSEEAAFYSI